MIVIQDNQFLVLLKGTITISANTTNPKKIDLQLIARIINVTKITKYHC